MRCEQELKKCKTIFSAGPSGIYLHIFAEFRAAKSRILILRIGAIRCAIHEKLQRRDTSVPLFYSLAGASSRKLVR